MGWIVLTIGHLTMSVGPPAIAARAGFGLSPRAPLPRKNDQRRRPQSEQPTYHVPPGVPARGALSGRERVAPRHRHGHLPPWLPAAGRRGPGKGQEGGGDLRGPAA